jgi:hypothetical protein
MKTSLILALGLAVLSPRVVAQALQGPENVLAEPVVLDRGPNHKTLERRKTITLEDGSVREEKGVTVQLGAGLNYRDPQNGELLESKAVISPYPNGAIAHQGQVKCAWASDLRTRGALQIATEETLISGQLIGLAMTDAASGQSFMLAEVRSSQGVIDSESTLTYPDMLDSISCNLTYRLHTWGVEQDLTFLGPLNFTPEELNMSSATARLELFFEINEPPAALSKPVPIKSVLRGQALQLAMGPFSDNLIEFGALSFTRGKAFDAQGLSTAVPIGKSFTRTVDNRWCLVESIEYPAIQPALARFGKPQAALKPPPRQLAGPRQQFAPRAMLARALPPSPKLPAPGELHPMRKELKTAMISRPRGKEWTWDFVVTLNSGVTNYFFRGDYTYYISAPLSIYGATNIISGGTIIKFDHGETGASLNFQDGSSIQCNSTPFYPAVLTAMDDSSMGDAVGGSGAISGYYGGINMQNAGGDLHDLKIKYSGEAIKTFGYSNRISNLQLINCFIGIETVYSPVVTAVENILANNIEGTLFMGSYNTQAVQHLTANNVGTLSDNSDDALSLALTNAILFNVTNLGPAYVSADYIATNTSLGITGVTHGITLTNSPFQTVLGGHFYLGTNYSPLRDAGTTNIPPILQKELAAYGTTYAPTYYTNQISTTQTWTQIVQRDSDSLPDYGYHYPAIDYVVSGLTIITNGLLLMTNNVCVGIDYGASSWGLIFDGGKLLATGSPTEPIHLLRAHCIQENSSGNPGTRALFYDKGNSGTHGNSEARFRFSELTEMAEDGYSLYTGKNFSQFEITHSTLNYMVFIIAANKGNQVFGFTNNVIEWPQLNFDSGGTTSLIHLRNNLLRTCQLDVYNLTNTSTVMDNIFDTSPAYDHGHSLSNGWNAYFATTNYLTAGVSNTNLVTLTYQTGTLGKYYQPTNSPLIDRGSLTNAGLVGLYHFTSTTNNVKETNSVLNIGNHYVATDTAGNPLDSDRDGLADYYENSNGSGVKGTGETDWQNADTDGDGVNDYIELLQGRNPFVSGSTNDVNGLINLRVYTPLQK